MITQQRSVRLHAVTQVPSSVDTGSVGSELAGRSIQMALALYLVPALLIVLLVGGVGMLVLMVGRLFTGPVHRPVG